MTSVNNRATVTRAHAPRQVLTIDWLMDRFRTTVNVIGDSVVAAIVMVKVRGPGWELCLLCKHPH